MISQDITNISNIEFQLPISFKKIVKAYKSGDFLIGSQGGSSSGKTYNWLLLFIIKFCYDTSTKGELLTIATDTFPNLRHGAIKDFKELREKYGFDFEYHKTNNVATFPLGGTIEFRALDTFIKGKGARRDYLFLNEANRMEYETAYQMIMRTKKRVVLDFNPDIAFWYHTKFLNKLDSELSVYHFITTYKDLGNLCPKASRIAIEDRKYDLDIENKPLLDKAGKPIISTWYKVYGLGEIGEIEGLVYENVHTYRDVSEFPNEECTDVIGLDFGWTAQSAAVRLRIFPKSKKIYCQELFYEVYLSNEQIANRLRENNGEEYPVIADSADPKAIYQIKQLGINIHGAKKDKIENDLRLFGGYTFYYHKDSVNLRAEQLAYKFEEDKTTGDLLPTPRKTANHLLDAKRYGASIMLRRL